MSKSHSPNDHRSIVNNPNNPAHQADRDNRSVQVNPESPKSGEGTGGQPKHGSDGQQSTKK